MLQRAVIMSTKSLFPQTLEHFLEIARGENQSPLTNYEARLVREGLSSRPFYGGGVRSSPETLAGMRRMARESRALGDLCSHLRSVILKELMSSERTTRRGVGDATRTRVSRTVRLVAEFARLIPLVP